MLLDALSASPIRDSASAPLLAVEGLRVEVAGPTGPLAAVESASFTVGAGRTLGLVGESGCGKTLACLAVMGLLPPRARIAGGRVAIDGPAAPGRDVAMIYQDPAASLNPVLRVGRQIAEPLVLHRGMGWRAALAEAARLLDRVGIADAKRRLDAWPHELSGGMSQRAMIAMALATRPRLLIADEPTTALDVTIQAQILALLADLQEETGMGMVLVTHDLGVVAEIADDVAVMYAGRTVEAGPVERIFAQPAHPYTEALLGCLPRLEGVPPARLASIPGQVPAIADRPSGCSYAPRCGRAVDACGAAEPLLAPVGERHQAACIRPAR